jgi:hypothetical protein
MIEGAKKGGGSIDSQTVGKLVGINKALREAMEQSSPDYKAAQEAYRQLTREVVSPMQNSLVGVLAKVKDVDAAKAASKMFSNQVIQSPENIRKARMAIQQAEKTDEAYAGAWDGIVSQYLKNSSDKALRETASGDAASLANRFRQAIAPTPRSRAVLREAFGGGREGAQRMQTFDAVMGALDKVARVPTASSETAFFQQIFQSLNSNLQNVGMFVVSPLESTKRAITDVSVEKALVQAAEAIMDPKKAAALKALRSMKPSRERNLIIAGVVTGSVAIDSIEGFLQP